MNIKKIKSFDDKLGSLIPIELLNVSDFEVKRLFLVKDVPVGTLRGDHAHYKTKQIIFCISGQIEIILFDGQNEERKVLNKNEYVYVDNLVWDSQKFLTKDAILFVLASTKYDINDYIFDKNKFIKIVNGLDG